MARKAKKDENYLDYIPAVSTKNSWDADAEGNVTIHMVHRGFYAWIAQKVFHRPRVSHIDLDEMGSFIFPLIDGERTVGRLRSWCVSASARTRSRCTSGWRSICRSCATTASSTTPERTGHRNDRRTDYAGASRFSRLRGRCSMCGD